MARTFIRQDTQIRRSDVYDDTVAPTLANYETNTVNIEDDLNSARSMLSYLKDIQTGNWYDPQTAPSALEAGTLRGVDNLNDDLHALEVKRVLKCTWGLKTIAIAAAGNTFDILALSEIPANTQARVGITTDLGTVVADGSGGFGAASLAEVAGPTAISPINMVQIVESSTRDPLLDAGDKIYGLLQGETATDFTITGTTPNRVQISFVKVNGTGDDLIAITSGAMDGVSYDYCYVERVRLEDLNEADFLGGANVDVPSGSTVTRQVAYDNQGATVVNTTSAATVDLGTGLAWELGDDDSAPLFTVTEGSAGSTSTVALGAQVDVFDVDAIVNNFDAGVTIRSGGTRPIAVGVNDGLVESTAGDLEVKAAAELILNDANMVAEGTWAGPGVKVTETTAEVVAYEAAFGGEVSLFNAIVQAANNGARGVKVYANCTATTTADTDVGGTAGGANLDAQLPDMSGGDYLTEYDVFVNGQLERPGANAAANNDYYPGTSLALGQIKFEYVIKTGDVIAVIPYA